jgi:hypothetical protein
VARCDTRPAPPVGAGDVLHTGTQMRGPGLLAGGPGLRGNALVWCTATAPAGDLLRGGLGHATWLLNRMVTSRDEAALLRSLASWPGDPRFAYLYGWWHPALLVIGNSPRFDAFGNDFRWGRLVAVRSGAGNKVDGRATVYQGRRPRAMPGPGASRQAPRRPRVHGRGQPLALLIAHG